MENTHVTAEGRRMPIVSMDDSHLTNTINMHIKNIKNASVILESWAHITWVTGVIYGYGEEEMKEDAERAIRKSYEKLKDYIIEAVIRWIDFSASLKDAMWRKEEEALPSLPF